VLRAIKEWQAIMAHLRRLPVKNPGELRVIRWNSAAEVRAIKVGGGGLMPRLCRAVLVLRGQSQGVDLSEQDGHLIPTGER
jgi:hypothetical protein